MSHISPPQAWRSYQERFSEMAKLHREHIALVDRNRSFSYQEVDRLTDRLSRYLQAKQAKPNDLIVVYMSASAEYVIACLAILKAGAGFLPIPTDLPPRQIEMILADAQPKVILTQTDHHKRLQQLGEDRSTCIQILDSAVLRGEDADFNEWVERTSSNSAVVSNAPNHYAFATYTSGTTGKPKGVLQIQRALLASYDARHHYNPYGDRERVACHVFFMWEILRPLLVGATTVVIPDEIISVPKALVKYLRLQEVTEVLFTPSVFQRIIRSLSAEETVRGFNHIRTIWLNGEVVTTKLVEDAVAAIPKRTKLLNTYSICECHDVSNSDLRALNLNRLHQKKSENCPVGYADEGVVIRVKTEQGLVSTGEGELYIGGHGLGGGYLHLDQLTAERFPTVDGERYYATGDLAHVDEDGLITIKGRLGVMVKMRGYSVYLNAIEEALHGHPMIQDVRVFLRGEHLSQHLTAFLVGPVEQLESWIHEESQSAPKLREWLKTYLPSYMIPSKWVRLDYFPVHPISGKLDQKLLWSLERNDEEDVYSLEQLMQAPQSSWDECVTLMRHLWARALEVPLGQVTAEADFYELGGHSLSMVDLVLSIEQVFQVTLNGDEIYEQPRLGSFLRVALREHAAWSDAQLTEIDQPLATEETKETVGGVFWEDEDLDVQWPTWMTPTLSKSHEPRVRLNDAQHIFLTGGTGHLGVSLLAQMLTSIGEDAVLTCLVRASFNEAGELISGQHRLSLRFKQAGLGDLQPYLDRGQVRVIEGDLCDPLLGLNSEAYQELCKAVDLIIHCAAFVNLRAAYTQTKPSIVDGSRHILHFAATHRVKTLHYISTNSVLAHHQEGTLKERAVTVSDASLLSDGYSRAKWVAEQLMAAGADDGIPVTIYRPGNIGPHRQTAYTNPDDMITLILDGCIQGQAAPRETGWRFELTPVDLVAEMIIEAACLVEPADIYHIVNPLPFEADHLFAEWYEQGQIKSLHSSWRDWRSELLCSAEPVHRVLGASLVSFDELLKTNPHFSIDHLCRDLPSQAAQFEKPLELSSLFRSLLG